MNKEHLDELTMMFRTSLKPQGMVVTEYMTILEIHKAMRTEIEKLSSEVSFLKSILTEEQLVLLSSQGVKISSH